MWSDVRSHNRNAQLGSLDLLYFPGLDSQIRKNSTDSSILWIRNLSKTGIRSCRIWLQNDNNSQHALTYGGFDKFWTVEVPPFWTCFWSSKWSHQWGFCLFDCQKRGPRSSRMWVNPFRFLSKTRFFEDFPVFDSRICKNPTDGPILRIRNRPKNGLCDLTSDLIG